MAEKTYRFLLRMPEHLRGKLAASAQRHGRSLNSELVHRLEEDQDDSGALGEDVPSGDSIARDFQRFLRQRGPEGPQR